MSSKREDGGPAFQSAGRDGMSLRDYFAGQALAGLLACPIYKVRNHDLSDAANLSYRYADAMLAQWERFGDGRWHQWADAVDYMSRLEDRIKELERELAAAKEETK